MSAAAADAEPKSLLETKIDPAAAELVLSPRHDQNFVDAVRTRKLAVSTLEDAVRSDIISHMCDIAVRTGHKITGDPRRRRSSTIWKPRRCSPRHAIAVDDLSKAAMYLAELEVSEIIRKWRTNRCLAADLSPRVP